ncbi:collagen alpha-1(I) chain-like [Choloepus didactylus]|uniref:collagen alpha-1(I) chain-like n=1 Tax=Choloepus didactylus TaxID=27675 RepID=UPI00189F9CC2|nr:collagen alpha-1(I) chain-like [Choloepus didactylus]
MAAGGTKCLSVSTASSGPVPGSPKYPVWMGGEARCWLHLGRCGPEHGQGRAAQPRPTQMVSSPSGEKSHFPDGVAAALPCRSGRGPQTRGSAGCPGRPPGPGDLPPQSPPAPPAPDDLQPLTTPSPRRPPGPASVSRSPDPCTVLGLPAADRGARRAGALCSVTKASLSGSEGPSLASPGFLPDSRFPGALGPPGSARERLARGSCRELPPSQVPLPEGCSPRAAGATC